MRCEIEQALKSILANPKPIIFVDTCSLLDILRAAYRSNVNVSHLNGARDLIKKAANNQLYIVATTTVETEFQEHLRATSLELERFVNELATKNAAMMNTIECLGLSYNFSVAGLTGLKLTDGLQKIAEDVFASAIILERDANSAQKAMHRLERNQAPAARGKQESKDCLIIEHYLKLANDLRIGGYLKKIIFITSNSNDYGKPNLPRQPLDVELKEANIVYVNNFQWALQTAGFE